MQSPAFLGTAFPLLLIPSGCWLLGLFVTRNMSRTRKNWLSALSLMFTVTLMIALLLFRLAVRALAPPTGFRLSGSEFVALRYTLQAALPVRRDTDHRVAELIRSALEQCRRIQQEQSFSRL